MVHSHFQWKHFWTKSNPAFDINVETEKEQGMKTGLYTSSTQPVHTRCYCVSLSVLFSVPNAGISCQSVAMLIDTTFTARRWRSSGRNKTQRRKAKPNTRKTKHPTPQQTLSTTTSFPRRIYGKGIGLPHCGF